MFLNRASSARLAQSISRMTGGASFSTSAAKPLTKQASTEVYPDAKPATSHRYKDAVNFAEPPVFGDQTTKGAPIKYVISDKKKS